MALTLSVGFVVDDAIVMLENIVRHMEMGKPPLEAARDGAQEIGFTIVSMTLSLAAVFIPVLFMGGIVGRLFREFAVVIGLAVLISGFVSLTLTPMLASRFLRPPAEVAHHRLYNLSERAFAAMLRAYETGLRWSLGHRRTMMGVTATVTVLTGVLFALIPKGFIPSQDIGMLFGTTEAAQGMSFDAMVRHQKAVAAVIQADPDVETFTSSAGGFGGSLNTGRVWLRLKPRGERTASADEVVDRLRPKIAAIPGIKAYIQSPPAIQVGGRRSNSQYQLTLQGPDTDELYRAAPLLEAKLRALPGLTDVATDLYLKNPEVNLKIDRDKAAAVGVTPAQIEDALYTAYGQRQVSSIYAPNNEYQVVMELQPEYQNEPADLGAALRPVQVGPARAARFAGDGRHRRRSAHGQPLRPGAVRHPLVQPGSGGRAGPGRRAGREAGEGDAASLDLDQLPGHRAGVPVLDAGPRPPARPRRPGHLHGARHPVRELHPPAHDPLGAAARRRRRDRDPDDLRQRPQHLRLRRHHHAGRPRQEERHHDDRLRPRGAAQGGEEPRPTRSTRHASCASGRS